MLVRIVVEKLQTHSSLPRKPYRLRDDMEENDGAKQTTDDKGYIILTQCLVLEV